MTEEQKITVTIDGKEVSVDKDTTILSAANSIDIFIPTLCHSELVEPYSACRLCLVEIDNGRKKRLVTSCNYPIRKPITVKTKSERVKKHRKNILEMMLARWPNVKIIKDMAAFHGIKTPRYTSPLQDPQENACVLCGLCVRACEEDIWESALNFANRGPEREVMMGYGENIPQCEGCETCMSICPTHAIDMDKEDPNNPFDADLMRKAGMKLTREMVLLDDSQCRMRKVGTAHLTEIMDEYDLLPVQNYRFGSHTETKNIASDVFLKNYLTQGKPDGCWQGCTMACAKTADAFTLKTGPYKGDQVVVDGPEYETVGGCANMGIFDPEFVLEFNFYCDTYGLDTISTSTGMSFYMEMFEYGILNKERCGGLDLQFGNSDAALTFMHRMAAGDKDEFIQVASKGIRRVKDWLIKKGWGDKQIIEDCGMESKGLEYSEYVTKESLAQQGGYGMTLKGPQHDEAWLIFMDMVNNQIPTFQDKAEALHYFPMWRTWFGLNGLCKLPWNDVEPENNAETDEPAKVPGHVQNYVDYQNGMTGGNVDKEGLILQSERAYNWQRAMNVWMGRGTRNDDWIPYRSMGPVTKKEYESRKDRYDTQFVEQLGFTKQEVEKMSIEEKIQKLYEYRQNRYQKLMDAVYYRRGWTPNGIPTPQKMKQLGFSDKKMLSMLQKKIDQDQEKGLNSWGGIYGDDEQPPTDKDQYWLEW
ncbi:MAG: (2Fe-2S)-binding protein [Candidatus Thermoplasmatota archaeon]|nr:(2Fe-2S)-binding protein [Candidatus Thermoplasmatota archaeon]